MNFTMGILTIITQTLPELLSSRSVGLIVSAALFTFFVVAVLLNVLSQLIFKNSNKPPVVFHWIPFIGSTVTYGIDPYKFFFACREKVLLK